MPIIVAAPSRSDEEIAQRNSFRTYLNYLCAIQEYLSLIEPSGIIDVVTGSPEFHAIQKHECDHARISAILRNAWFTELQMYMPPGSEEMIAYYNHWAPVKLYYAVFLLLRAFLIASGQPDVKKEHARTLSAMSTVITNRPGLFSYPWRLLSTGDPKKNEFIHLPSGVNPSKVSTLSSRADFWDSYSTFLRTTRERELDHKVLAWKERTKKQRLPASARAELCSKLHATSLFHVLYRLRIKSNYSDADAYLTTLEETGDALRFYAAVRDICWHTLLALELLIKAYIGIKNYEGLIMDFMRYDRNGALTKLVAERYEYMR